MAMEGLGSVFGPTLVKFNHPTAVHAREHKRLKIQLTQDDRSIFAEIRGEIPRIPEGLAIACEGVIQTKQDTIDILNAIVPPREWVVGSRLWRQSVSTVPATKSDVIALQELLDRRLKESNARETGICHTRRELYTQFFDELIRQVAIISAERGLLLLRVRNEIRRTFKAYEALYISGMTSGVRKAIMAEMERDVLKKQTVETAAEIDELRRTVAELHGQFRSNQERYARRRETLKRMRSTELASQREANEQLKLQIWSAVFPRLHAT